MRDNKPDQPSAIETLYDGHAFRSRLEARWAVFFNMLGVKYQYEPEGFKTSSSGGGKENTVCYLPDFCVQCYGTRGEIGDEPFPLYIEVKGSMSKEDAKKIKALSVKALEGKRMPRTQRGWEKMSSGYLHLLVVSDVPGIKRNEDIYNSDVMRSYDSLGYDIYPFNYETIDCDYFAAYPAVDAHGHFYLMGDDCNYINVSPEECAFIADAYRIARQARFEHGEKPPTKPLYPFPIRGKTIDISDAMRQVRKTFGEENVLHTGGGGSTC